MGVNPGKVKTNYQRFAEAVAKGISVEPGFRRAAELQKVLDLAIEADRARKEMGVVSALLPPGRGRSRRSRGWG